MPPTVTRTIRVIGLSLAACLLCAPPAAAQPAANDPAPDAAPDVDTASDLDRAARLELTRPFYGPRAISPDAAPLANANPPALPGLPGSSLRIGGNMQFLFINNARDRDDDDNDGFTNGTQFRRLRLVFSGKLDDRVGFKIETEGADGDFGLLEAWISYQLTERWRIRAGQFKNGFNRIRSTSSTRTQLVDRPVLISEIQPQPSNRTQGIEAQYLDDTQRFIASFNEGSSGVNTSFTEDEQDFAFTLRYDRSLAGSIDHLTYLSSPPGSDFGALVGAAFHFQDGENNTGNRIAWNTDFSLMGDGWSIHGAYLGHSAEDLNAQGEPEVINAFYVQGGVFVSPTVELVARYEHALTSADDDELSIALAGINWFVYGRALKLSTDVTYAFQPVSSTFARTNDGLLVDDTGNDGQISWRVQFQLLF